MRRRGRESADAALRPRERHQSPGPRTIRRSDCSSPSCSPIARSLTKNDQPVEQLERDIRTTNKWMDAIPAAWLRRNVFQPGRTSPAAWSCTVPRLIGRPRSRASAVRRITAALPQGILLAHSSDEVAALAVDLEGGHHVGTISSANRPESPADASLGLDHSDRIQNLGENRYSQTKINRSKFRSRNRDRDLRLKTITC